MSFLNRITHPIKRSQRNIFSTSRYLDDNNICIDMKYLKEKDGGDKNQIKYQINQRKYMLRNKMMQ